MSPSVRRATCTRTTAARGASSGFAEDRSKPGRPPSAAGRRPEWQGEGEVHALRRRLPGAGRRHGEPEAARLGQGRREGGRGQVDGVTIPVKGSAAEAQFKIVLKTNGARPRRRPRVNVTSSSSSARPGVRQRSPGEVPELPCQRSAGETGGQPREDSPQRWLASPLHAPAFRPPARLQVVPRLVEVTLEPGVAVVVGPNGSGTNVPTRSFGQRLAHAERDARGEARRRALWRLGGRPPPTTARSSSSSTTRTAASATSSTTARSRSRGGSSAVGRVVSRQPTPVRRTDLVELLADVGLGGSMHSIVSQGKVDAVLASSPRIGATSSRRRPGSASSSGASTAPSSSSPA